MTPSLRDRILQKLDTLSDERGLQVLDYVEFLESKYAERQAPPPNVFTKFAEGVEGAMRAGRVSATTVAQTMDLMNKAMGVLSGVTAAGKSVASDIVTTAQQITTNPLQKPPAGEAGAAGATTGSTPAATPNAAPPAPAPDASPKP